MVYRTYLALAGASALLGLIVMRSGTSDVVMHLDALCVIGGPIAWAFVWGATALSFVPALSVFLSTSISIKKLVSQPARNSTGVARWVIAIYIWIASGYLLYMLTYAS
jgi:hypothetical protein